MTPKLSKAAVLYLEPHSGEGHQFAQCGTCRMFLAAKKRCTILGDTEIGADDSCGLYVPGSAEKSAAVSAAVTPKEAGLVRDTKVRCENCEFGGESKCGHPALGFPIISTGCCNAWSPKKAYKAAPWLGER